MKYLNFANSVTDSSKQEHVMALIDLSPSMDETTGGRVEKLVP